MKSSVFKLFCTRGVSPVIGRASQEPALMLTLMVCERVMPGTPWLWSDFIIPPHTRAFVFNNDDTPQIDKDILIALFSVAVFWHLRRPWLPWAFRLFSELMQKESWLQLESKAMAIISFNCSLVSFDLCSRVLQMDWFQQLGYLCTAGSLEQNSLYDSVRYWICLLPKVAKEFVSGWEETGTEWWACAWGYTVNGRRTVSQGRSCLWWSFPGITYM